LFPFRPIILILGLNLPFFGANAQLVDGVLGRKRTVVQVLLRPYRIINYEKDRVVYALDDGVRQTVLYKNDTCMRFHWTVAERGRTAFEAQLLENGYRARASNGFEKDSLQLTTRQLDSGKATRYMAAISQDLSGNRAASGRKVREERTIGPEAIPLLQQTVQAEEADTTPKPPIDPERNWIGGRYGRTSILGWEK